MLHAQVLPEVRLQLRLELLERGHFGRRGFVARMRLGLPPALHHQLQLRLLLLLRLQMVGELPLQLHLLAQRRLLGLDSQKPHR